ELGTTKSTVRRWLKRDHWDLWMEHWASADELWEAPQRGRELSARDKSVATACDLRADRDRLLVGRSRSGGQEAVSANLDPPLRHICCGSHESAKSSSMLRPYSTAPLLDCWKEKMGCH